MILWLQELRPLSQLVHGAEPGYFCILALQVTLQGLFVPAGIVFAKIKWKMETASREENFFPQL